MTRTNLSYLVWSLWLLAFVVLELLGVYRVFGWVTLSETSWTAQREHPWLTVPLFGFLVGLSFHIALRLGLHQHVTLWRATLFGVIVAAALHWIVSPALP